MKAIRLARSLLVFCLITISIDAAASSSSGIESEMIQVFVKESSYGRNLEIIRLYQNNVYEHLRYRKKRNFSVVHRHIGTYQLRGSKLYLSFPVHRKFSSSNYNKWFYVKKNIYSNRLASLAHPKQPLFTLANNDRYRKPYFINPISDVLAGNREIVDSLKLEELVNYIIRNDETDEQKAMSIARFIMKSISYDYDYLRTGKHACSQADSRQILAGRERVAVCAGYAYAFNELATLAGLKCKRVAGNTRNSLNDISRIGGYHAWNIVWFGNEPKFFDVTWADGGDEYWLAADPRLMIYSHFPDKPEDQLLKDVVSFETFKHFPIAIPVREGPYVPFSEQAGTVFCDSVFHIAFFGQPSITCRTTKASVFSTAYSSERAPAQWLSYHELKGVKKVVAGDSTHLYIPVKDAITPIQFRINRTTLLSYKVVKGDFEDLMHYYIAQANNNYAEALAKGIIASIYLDKQDKIAELASDTSAVFFNSSGRYSLDKSVIGEIKNWDGTLSAWTVNKSMSYGTDADEKLQRVVSIENSFEITNRLKLIFVKRDNHIVVTELRLARPFFSFSY